MSVPDWRTVVLKGRKAIKKNSTWELTELSKRKQTVGCKWIFNVKCKANGSTQRFKARLIAMILTQAYGIDYQEPVALVAKLNTVCLVILGS